MSPSTVQIRKARVEHIVAIILLARAQRVLSPALFYVGLKDYLSGASQLNGNEQLQDVADLLFATGVSRFRVAEMCRPRGVEGRVLIEYWDSIQSERKKPPPASAPLVS